MIEKERESFIKFALHAQSFDNSIEKYDQLKTISIFLHCNLDEQWNVCNM
jgi:hypothetical protein